MQTSRDLGLKFSLNTECAECWRYGTGGTWEGMSIAEGSGSITLSANYRCRVEPIGEQV